ncbi:hypothetical protein PPACK8108_LOCUS5100 [Phakopsora pachyrhizi]|uniref:Zn(2)-C6 fungal-type domain-containing protein n=1 Tax=Phakopsora pachyrhizi TaxID=170000 RepID=A0AAV0AN99_PHAPC|nr:hypothetical protein PPACK8108_LOCUS5100 [Phakopsora pachyrhizi]
MDGTNGFTAVKQLTTPCEFCKRNQLVCCASTTGKSAKCEACRVNKVKCNISEPTETRAPLGKSRLMVAVGIPSEQTEVEDTQDDLRNEVEPATQKSKECMKEEIDLEEQSQGTRSPSVERIRVPARPTDPTTQPPPQHQPPIPSPSVSYSNPVNSPGHHPEIEASPSSLDRLSPGLGLVPWIFDHPSGDVLEFENDKERARRLLENTHRLLGVHVGEMVKGASNHKYSEFVQRGQEIDGLLTYAIT